MTEYLGLDTSNYTTSAAIFDSSLGTLRQQKKLLPVKEGERGLRQSDAIFHHVRQLPEVTKGLLSRNIRAIGVSTRPRSAEGSYMPCFSAGETAASILAEYAGVPLYRTSHQIGHILAALYSCGRLDLLRSGEPFIAFHVSGGTTDCILAKGDPEKVLDCRELASSTDLKAGQAVDRVGVMLGLRFPCGMELERLALESRRSFQPKPAMKGGSCCLSGVENLCRDMLNYGEKSCDIALFCIKYIGSAIVAMTEHALREQGDLPLIYAGGVMSDSIIKKSLSERFDASFAEPALSSDNACGTAIFAAIKDGYK